MGHTLKIVLNSEMTGKQSQTNICEAKTDFWAKQIADLLIESLTKISYCHSFNDPPPGNMGGLFNDLVSGLSVGLDGDVSGMVKNMAHGMSDTASKLSSTASTVLAYVSADEKFRQNRDLQRAGR